MTILEVHLLANSSVLSVLPESTTKMSSLMSATLPRHCAIFSSSFRVKTIMERLVTWFMQKHSRPDVETHARIFPSPIAIVDTASGLLFQLRAQVILFDDRKNLYGGLLCIQ